MYILYILSFTALFCSVLYHNLFSCPVLYCTVLSCTVLHCFVLSCNVLYCPACQCPVLACPVLYCTVLYCNVLYCTVLQCPVLSCPEAVLKGWSRLVCQAWLCLVSTTVLIQRLPIQRWAAQIAKPSVKAKLKPKVKSPYFHYCSSSKSHILHSCLCVNEENQKAYSRQRQSYNCYSPPVFIPSRSGYYMTELYTYYQ